MFSSIPVRLDGVIFHPEGQLYHLDKTGSPLFLLILNCFLSAFLSFLTRRQYGPLTGEKAGPGNMCYNIGSLSVSPLSPHHVRRVTWTTSIPGGLWGHLSPSCRNAVVYENHENILTPVAVMMSPPYLWRPVSSPWYVKTNCQASGA